MEPIDVVANVLENDGWAKVEEPYVYRKVILDKELYDEYYAVSDGEIKSNEIVLDLEIGIGECNQPMVRLLSQFLACRKYLNERSIGYRDEAFNPLERVTCLIIVCRDVMTDNTAHFDVMAKIENNQN